MPNPRDKLRLLPSTFSVSEAVAAGVARRTLYRWRDENLIIEISRGVYRHSDAPETTYLDYLAAAKRAPRAIVCLVSALALHDLTDELPRAIQLALPTGTTSPKISYPPVKFSKFRPETFDVGKESFLVTDDEEIAVYCAERAVVDAIRFRRLVTDAVAFGALRNYLTRPGSDPGELTHIARILGNSTHVMQALQVLLST